MNIVGKKIRHKTLGTGVVLSQSNSIIEVSFTSKVSKFIYPEAFALYLTSDDCYTQSIILQEIESKHAAERAAQEQESMQHVAKVLPRSQSPKQNKKYERLNIAFKCNYCDGGKSKNQIGYNGVCSDEIIKNNILKEKRTWCTQEDCPCFQYINLKISRDELDAYCDDGEGSVCYESRMLRDWIASAGIYSRGEKCGEPMKLKQVQTNSLCILTTRDPGTEEAERYVFGVFLVDETYEGDNSDEGYVTTKSRFKIKLSTSEAHNILFWRYYANSKQPESARWGTGLHRYINDDIAIQILLDIAKAKKGSLDESLANEFVDYFAKSNQIIVTNISAPHGAINQAKK